MRRALELIRLRLGRTWILTVVLSTIAMIFAGLWWEFDVMEISDDERGAYDDGLKAFTLPKRAGLKFVQQRFGLGKLVRSEDVMVVALDDGTMTYVSENEFMAQRYGRNLPFDRIIWADLVTYLSKAGARAIVFDMVMNEPSSNGLGDLAFGKALEEIETPVILGFSTAVTAKALPKIEPSLKRPVGKMPEPPQKEVPEGEFPEDPTPEEKAALEKLAAENRVTWAAKAYAVPVVTKGLEVPAFPAIIERDANGEPTGKEFAAYPMAAIPHALEAADGFGAVTGEEDEDGKLRRTAFVYTDGTNTYATLPVALLARLENASEVVVEKGTLTVGARKIRINQDGTAELHYGGRLADRFPMVPLVNVVQRFLVCSKEDQTNVDCAGGDISKDAFGAQFKGKVVVVGGIAVGTGDSKATPLEQATPGLVKQAATIDNLLKDQFIIAAPTWASWLFAFFIAVLSVTLVLVVRNTFVDIGWPVLLYVGFFAITGSFLVATRIHVLSALPGLAGTVASILATTWERLFARKERERIKELFQNYMEADLVELMVEQKTLPSLEGQNLNVTAFFSDIKGFSTFSELLKDRPQELMRLLNRYLSIVTPKLTAEGACIDKYIGDAVVALFGAPVSYHDHPLRACRAALQVQKAIGELRDALRKEGLPDVYTRVGLNTGTMMVGNIGSAQLLDYTAIGDEMNLAARLEGANKIYGTLIMMGQNTHDAVRQHVEARELDRVRVAGKRNAVTVYELLAMKGEISATTRRVIDLYAQALALYRGRRFTQAKELLGKALEVDQSDGPSTRLLSLCIEFERHPPAPEWDGVSSLEK
ncbi:MAG: adenylate/guanylate cyclase domain-containing protein [Myxococcales bacterium]|nr:adenylate/guanylate cyclase domain-containing protein [Myxococcales bacterium]